MNGIARCSFTRLIIYLLQMQVLMNNYAEKENVNLSSLTFKFDGELLSGTETPISLELEGGECIDVYRNALLRRTKLQDE